MRLDLLSIGRARPKSLVGVLVQQLEAEVTRVVRQKAEVELGLSIFDILIELLAVLRVERGQADEHFVDDGAKGPPICRLSVALPLQHLWRKVLSCAAERPRFAMALNSHLGEAKICQLDVTLAVDKDILGLQTSQQRHMGWLVIARGENTYSR